jgi:hypothetical protein
MANYLLSAAWGAGGYSAIGHDILCKSGQGGPEIELGLYPVANGDRHRSAGLTVPFAEILVPDTVARHLELGSRMATAVCALALSGWSCLGHSDVLRCPPAGPRAPATLALRVYIPCGAMVRERFGWIPLCEGGPRHRMGLAPAT